MIYIAQSHLCVKRIFVQLVDTLELMGIGLHHDEAVLLPFEDLNLVKDS